MGRPPKSVSQQNIKRFELELELANNDSKILLNDKKGRSKACLLCKRRKQKCDHMSPSCTACLKSGVKCIQPDNYGAGTKSYGNSDSVNTGSVSNKANIYEINGNNNVSDSQSLQQLSLMNAANIGDNNSDSTMVSEKISSDNNSGLDGIVNNNTKNEYTKFLEKKLMYLEDLITLTPETQKFKTKLKNYKKITQFLDVKLKDYENIMSSMNNIVEKNQQILKQQQKLQHIQIAQASQISHLQATTQEKLLADSYQGNMMNVNNVINLGNKGLKPVLPLPPTSNFVPLSSTKMPSTGAVRINSASPLYYPPPVPVVDIRTENGDSDTKYGDSGYLDSTAISSPVNIDNSLLISKDYLGSIDFSKCIFAKYNLKDFLSYDPAFDFEEDLSRQFLDTYFTRLQFKYPLLDQKEVYDFHDYYINLNKSRPVNRNFGKKYSPVQFHYGCSRMWLIFAISACLHKTTGKYRGLPPNRYFSTSIRHITKCQNKMTDWEKMEILALLLLYIVRTDRDSLELYDIVKDVVHIALNELKLNVYKPNGGLKPPNNSQGDNDVNKRIRVFWCVYLLERMVCNAVEKKYLINESDISANFPLFTYQTFQSAILTKVFANKPSNATSSSVTSPPSSSSSNLSMSLSLSMPSIQITHSPNVFPDLKEIKKVHFINQTLKLRRLESKFVIDLDILNFVNKTKSRKVLKSHLPLVEKYFNELESWRLSCSLKFVRNFENETLKLYYYRSVRLLIQPYLELLKPEDRLFRECSAAAGQICQLYKTFHQKTVFGHSTPAVHTVFTSGLTLVYCLWLARNADDNRRRKLGDKAKHTRPTVSATLFAVFDDLRACSVCLYVMAERSKFAIIFRDTFDQLMNCTIGNLIERCGPDSSELITINQNGKPMQHSSSDESLSKVEQNLNSDNNEISRKYNHNKNEYGGIESEQKNHNVINNDNSHHNINANEYDLVNVALDKNKNVSQNDESLRKGGMPPAVSRTFGMKQECAHAGFLQNLQVDFEEQQELERKKGVLKKKMVPKSLSHLLAAYDDDEDEDQVEIEDKNSPEKNGNETEITPVGSEYSGKPPSNKRTFAETQSVESKSLLSNQTLDHDQEDMPNPKQYKTSINTPSSHHVQSAFGETSSSSGYSESPQYMVQKPTLNIPGEEWKDFQMQAFLQQQEGQQTLKAYLMNMINHTDILNSKVSETGLSPKLEESRTSVLPDSNNYLFKDDSNMNYEEVPQYFMNYSMGNLHPSPLNPLIRNRSSLANQPESPDLPMLPSASTIANAADENLKYMGNMQQSGVALNTGVQNMIHNISNWTSLNSINDNIRNNLLYAQEKDSAATHLAQNNLLFQQPGVALQNDEPQHQNQQYECQNNQHIHQNNQHTHHYLSNQQTTMQQQHYQQPQQHHQQFYNNDGQNFSASKGWPSDHGANTH